MASEKDSKKKQLYIKARMTHLGRCGVSAVALVGVQVPGDATLLYKVYCFPIVPSHMGTTLRNNNKP